MLIPNNKPSAEGDFDNFLKLVPKPYGEPNRNPNLGVAPTIFGNQPLNRSEHTSQYYIEKSQVIAISRDCMALDGSDVLPKVEQLIEMVGGASLIDDDLLDDFEATNIVFDQHQSYGQLWLRAYEKEVVKALLSHLVNRDQRVRDFVESTFLQLGPTDPRLLILAPVLNNSGETKEEVYQKAFESLVHLYSHPQLFEEVSDIPIVLTQLTCKRPSISSVEIHTLLKASTRPDYNEDLEEHPEDFEVDFTALDIEISCQEILKFHPESVISACIEVLRSPTSSSDSIAVACRVLEDANISTHQLGIGVLSSLLESQNEFVIGAAIGLCAALNDSQSTYFGEILALAKTDSYASEMALSKLPLLANDPEKIVRLEDFYEQECARLLEPFTDSLDESDQDWTEESSLIAEDFLDSEDFSNSSLPSSFRDFDVRRLQACIEGIGLLALQSNRMLALLAKCVEIPSPLVRNLIPVVLPKGGDLARLEGVLARMIEIAPMGIGNPVIKLLVLHYGEDGVRLLQDWFGISGKTRPLSPVLSLQQIKKGISSLEQWKLIATKLPSRH